MTELQTPTTRILSISSDSTLLSIREMLLEHAGYTVCSLSDRSITPEMKLSSFDLVLLCHSVPVARAESLGSWLKSRLPHIAIVRLASLYNDRKPSFDLVCDVQNGPVPLLKQLDGLRKLGRAAA